MLYLSAYVPTKSLKDECDVISEVYSLGGDCEAHSIGVTVWATGTAEDITQLLVYLYGRRDAKIEIERGDYDDEEKEV